MEKVVFADSWKEILAENGLKTFGDLYYNNKKKRINSNHRRNVSLFELNINGETRKFYLKRFRHTYIKDIIFVFLNTGNFLSQAAFEWSNIKLLKKNGIGAPNFICCGEETRFGFERRSFIVTEELKGQCLANFIAENWGKMQSEEKKKILVSLARTIKKIHKAWISMPDLYIWHIFVTKTNDEYDFSFIDLNRMKRHVTNPDEWVENLGRLHYSMIDKYFDEPTRRFFIETYAEKEKGDKIEKLIRKIRRYSRKFSGRRRSKPNY
ncbi:MAG: Lipopolysaccharide core heptose(I) kinase RfaP [Planctomycetes bacterium ADurb.Bin401]|nr:MAG: Lipopolysaccharide core heptose(I) kinase RfaP [Planctomycetes bacterium ADurb.Bin401]